MSIPGSDIPGGMFEDELNHLYWLGSTYPVILEIGALFGRSTKAFAARAKRVDVVDSLAGELSLPKEYQSYAGLSGEAQKQMFSQNLREEIGAGIVRPYWTTSLEFYQRLWDGTKYDLVFIDGAHDTQSVLLDCALALAMVEPTEGIIAGHDANYPPVMNAVYKVFPDHCIVLAPPLERIWLVP